MAGKYRLLLLSQAVALLALACHSTAPAPGMTVKYEVAPQPPRVGKATITLKLTHEDGQPVTGARVELEGNMTHAGMSPTIGEAKETEAGEYRGTLELTMAGDWIVLLNITLADGQQLQRRLELSGVRPK